MAKRKTVSRGERRELNLNPLRLKGGKVVKIRGI